MLHRSRGGDENEDGDDDDDETVIDREYRSQYIVLLL